MIGEDDASWKSRRKGLTSASELHVSSSCFLVYPPSSFSSSRTHAISSRSSGIPSSVLSRRYRLSSLPRAFTTTWFQPDLPIHSLEPLRIFAWFARWKFLFRSPAQVQHFLFFPFPFFLSSHNERFETCSLFLLSLVMSQLLLLITLRVMQFLFSLFTGIFFLIHCRWTNETSKEFAG